MGDLRLGIMVDAVDNVSGKLNGIASNVTGATKRMEGGLWSAGQAGDAARMKLAGLGSAATQIGATMTLAGGAIVGAFAAMTKSAMVQEDAENKLRVIYKGNADELIKYASAMQKQTRFGDEAIIGMMALGSTFPRLQGHMEEATSTALNMAEAYGMDLNQAMLLLGKAASGQTGALSRYGIMIDTARAKAEGLPYILKIIGNETKNAAFKVSSASKVWDQFKNAVSDIGEEIGMAFIPLMKSLTPILTKVAEWLGVIAKSPLGQFLAVITAGLGGLLLAAGTGILILGQLATAVSALASASAVLGGAGGLGAVIKGLVGVKGGVGLAAKGIGGLSKMFLMTPPHIAIAVAAIALLVYELWKLKGAYDDAKKAAEEANRAFEQSKRQKEWGVQTGRLDAAKAQQQAREVAAATPTLGERWTGMWSPGVTAKQLAEQRVFAEQAAPLSGVSQRRTAVAGHRGAPTVSAGMRRSTQAQTQVNVYVGDKPLEEKMYEVQERSARGAYGAVGL